MKRIIAIILAAVMVLSMSVLAFAAEEEELTIDTEHVDEAHVEIVTIADGTVTADGISLFALKLPQNVAAGETVCVHIKGSSDGDFRAWLLGDGTTAEKGTEATFSNQWKASENGFVAPGEFEKFMEFTAEDFDAQGLTEANRVAFKAPSWDSSLENLNLTYVGLIYGSIADVEADAVAEAQPFADAAASALEAANAAADEAALNAALADAEAAVEALTEKAELGFPGVTAMLNDAKSAVREINALINGAAVAEALESIQGDVDAVNSALAAAQSAGDDLDALNKALADAKAAAEKVQAAADSSDYKEVSDAAKEAASAVSDIEKLVSSAEAAKKAAEEEAARIAEEEAAKKQKTTTITIIVIVVVVVLVVIVAAVVAAMSKKKKK